MEAKTIEQKIDLYGDKKLRMDALEEELKNLRQEIIDEMKELERDHIEANIYFADKADTEKLECIASSNTKLKEILGEKVFMKNATFKMEFLRKTLSEEQLKSITKKKPGSTKLTVRRIDGGDCL